MVTVSEWEALHLKLQEVLRAELEQLRSLLNWLTEREQAIFAQKAVPDIAEFTVLQEKGLALQKRREQMIAALTGQASCTLPELEQALAKDIDNSSETLTLWGQIFSLKEKIEEYESRYKGIDFAKLALRKASPKKRASKKLDIL